MKNRKLFTIGYQGTNQDVFFDRILSKGINVIIDVRAIPHSRKKGFSKSGLASRSSELGLKYEHIGALGSPDDIRNEFRTTGDFREFARNYLRELSQQSELLDDLSKRIVKTVCCLLCYEKAPLECHRSLIASEIAKRAPGPLRVLHL